MTASSAPTTVHSERSTREPPQATHTSATSNGVTTAVSFTSTAATVAMIAATIWDRPSGRQRHRREDERRHQHILHPRRPDDGFAEPERSRKIAPAASASFAPQSETQRHHVTSSALIACSRIFAACSVRRLMAAAPSSAQTIGTPGRTNPVAANAPTRGAAQSARTKSSDSNPMPRAGRR